MVCGPKIILFFSYLVTSGTVGRTATEEVVIQYINKSLLTMCFGLEHIPLNKRDSKSLVFNNTAFRKKVVLILEQ